MEWIFKHLNPTHSAANAFTTPDILKRKRVGRVASMPSAEYDVYKRMVFFGSNVLY